MILYRKSDSGLMILENVYYLLSIIVGAFWNIFNESVCIYVDVYYSYTSANKYSRNLEFVGGDDFG